MVGMSERSVGKGAPIASKLSFKAAPISIPFEVCVIHTQRNLGQRLAVAGPLLQYLMTAEKARQATSSQNASHSNCTTVDLSNSLFNRSPPRTPHSKLAIIAKRLTLATLSDVVAIDERHRR